MMEKEKVYKSINQQLAEENYHLRNDRAFLCIVLLVFAVKDIYAIISLW